MTTRPVRFLALVSLAGCPDAPADPHEPPELGAGPTTKPTAPHDPGMADEPTSSAASSSGSSASTGEGTGTTTTSADAGSSSGPDVPSDSCGDGVVDVALGETCDDSYLGNADNAKCTQQCQLAFCGDGLVWAGMETCDDGPANNDQTYGGCTESCVPGPRCGDGVLQLDAGEECDPDESPVPDGTAACMPGACRFAARLAFATAAKFTGAIGGLDAADQRCAEAAAGAGLDNAQRFKAWLSDGAATPASRLTTAIADVGYPYATVGGLLIAADLADLIAHGPSIPIDITETGVKLPPEDELAWTNIGPYGQPTSPFSHCKKWKSASFQAEGWAGQISPASESDLPAWKNEGRWTSVTSQLCGWEAHLYCLED